MPDSEPSPTIASYLAAFEPCPGHLDFARSGPPARSTAQAAAAYWSRMTMGDVDEASEDAAARVAVSRLTGFAADDIALIPNTSLGLFHTAFALRGAEVLVSRGEFPANLYPWWRAEELGILRVRDMPGARLTAPVTPERVAAALRPSTTAVAVSAVDFRTGWRADLAGLRETIGDRLLIVDAIQAAGVVDLPWHLADVVVAGGQKWLRAGWGTGFVAVSERARTRLAPRLSGWTAVERPTSYDGRRHPLAAGAQHMRVTNGSPASAHVLSAALGLVTDVGVPEIERLVSARVTALDDRLRAGGADVVSPAAASDRAGIVVARWGDGSAGERRRRLADAGITTTLHGPDRIRLSVHATTTLDDIETAASVLLS
ncbi:aminotransferase class V-fold PLP-dependent enzyme [Microbacterium sp. NPDC055910]|uniref:aminotransferase class V-fold PLP-dependent enzyme n=1 Tax=Microbacterium sp. NPDC055910 TaxID=3345659 RepID=UPI0035E1DB0D